MNGTHLAYSSVTKHHQLVQNHLSRHDVCGWASLPLGMELTDSLRVRRGTDGSRKRQSLLR